MRLFSRRNENCPDELVAAIKERLKVEFPRYYDLVEKLGLEPTKKLA